MPQSLAAVYVHVVFSTKNREPLIDPELATRLFPYIGGVLRGSKNVLLASGGMPDHVHLLISIGREQSISEMIGSLKSASSRWVHDTFPSRGAFAWQSGYGAFSVSPSQVDAVLRYVEGQEEHHRIRSFQEEYRDFLDKYGVEFDERYVWD